MSVEAGGIQGWERWAHAPFGMARFGASAPCKPLYEKFGYTVENLTKQASAFPKSLVLPLKTYSAFSGAGLKGRPHRNLAAFSWFSTAYDAETAGVFFFLSFFRFLCVCVELGLTHNRARSQRVTERNILALPAAATRRFPL